MVLDTRKFCSHFEIPIVFHSDGPQKLEFQQRFSYKETF